ncbi:MAG: hypothetical protein HOA17_07670 [Candidatus Melainabacteria bacterium]|jgi:hypothetical protein|nr:hypothetical protein [Candidatus Melainabacteria bacterium]
MSTTIPSALSNPDQSRILAKTIDFVKAVAKKVLGDTKSDEEKDLDRTITDISVPETHRLKLIKKLEPQALSGKASPIQHLLKKIEGQRDKIIENDSLLESLRDTIFANVYTLVRQRPRLEDSAEVMSAEMLEAVSGNISSKGQEYALFEKNSDIFYQLLTYMIVDQKAAQFNENAAKEFDRIKSKVFG